MVNELATRADAAPESVHAVLDEVAAVEAEARALADHLEGVEEAIVRKRHELVLARRGLMRAPFVLAVAVAVGLALGFLLRILH